MKDPCVSCPKDTSCKTTVCEKWEEYIKSYRDRNATQMRITQYMKEYQNEPKKKIQQIRNGKVVEIE